MDWKEVLNRKLAATIRGERVVLKTVELVQQFISTEIIEKLIEDIPDSMIVGMRSVDIHFKEQLRDKWL